MELEQVTAVVRPRGPWEAIDLGFGLARTQWRAVWTAWGLVSLPVLVLVWVLLRDLPVLAVLAAWWLKPLLGVMPLFALSRALFGAPPGPGETLRAWPRLWARNLLPALILWRLDPRRTFRAPVWVLEGLRGGARRRRLRVIGKRHHLSALGLAAACALLEVCLLASLLVLGWLLLPTGVTPELGALFGGLFGGESELALALFACAHVGALTIVEPCYVAAGFALYVNRRVQLEGWDLELAFRQLARRLRQERAEAEETERLARAASSRRAAALGALLLAAAGLLPAPARAQEPAPEREQPAPAAPQDPQEVAREVLEDPVFGGKRTVTRRELHMRGCEPARSGPPSAGAPGLAGLSRVVLIALVTLVAVTLVVLAVRVALLAGPRERRRARAPLPEVLMGLDLRPETLPADVPGEAARLWRRGEHAPALSLLYRGALARLLARHELHLPPSATEGDCLEAVRKARGPVAWFGRLTRAWQQVAYAGRLPADEEVLALCEGWREAFLHRVGPAEGAPGTGVA